MKLLTLNTHSWMEENQEEKIESIAQQINKEQYDVIALQEVNQSINKKRILKNVREDNFAYVLVEKLKQLGCLDYNLVWDFSHIGYDKYEEGTSIITRHNIDKFKSFFVSKNDDIDFWKTRKITCATIEINKQLIDFYSCHLGWWDDEEEPFKEQVDRLFKANNNHKTAFYMGDFNNNAFLSGKGYDYLMKKGVYDTFCMTKVKDNGVTVNGNIDGWSSNDEGLRLDLILSNKKLDVEYSKVVFNGKNQSVVSDHYGVEVKIGNI